MDRVTYPEPSVASYMSAHFVGLKPVLDEKEHWPLFRTKQIIWTPTAGFMDRNGAMHYDAPGYLPPGEFLSVLKIGRARCLMAWTRCAEAAEELESAAEPGNSTAPEALWWLGVARFLERRQSAPMWQAWDRLVALYPESAWAKRVYERGAGYSLP